MAATPALIRERILEIAGAMPSTPRVFADLSRLLRDANSPLKGIAELIKRDTALTAHIIRVSNSVVYRSEQRTGSVEEAVSRLGYREILALTGYVAGVQLADRALKYYGVEAVQLRENMLHTAFMCEQLAPECRIDPRLAYTAGLVRPLGLFVCDRLADRWPGTEPYQAARDRDYAAWEARLFGIGNCEVAALVLQEWRFPDEIIAAIRGHYLPEGTEAPQRLACLLNLASGLIANEGQGLSGEARYWEQTPQKLEIVGLNARKLRNLATKANELFAGFQQRMEGQATAEAATKRKPKAEAVSPDSCDFPPSVGVVRENDETPVHTTNADAEVTAAPLDFTTFMRNY
ncbi:MAG: HDOD domain-containing protein, partial [Methyloceanibacter sp.]|nr:HDOD domain-containing protein [Methyloceanibacter sp.]